MRQFGMATQANKQRRLHRRRAPPRSASPAPATGQISGLAGFTPLPTQPRAAAATTALLKKVESSRRSKPPLAGTAIPKHSPAAAPRRRAAKQGWESNWQCEGCRAINGGGKRVCGRCAQRRPSLDAATKATAPELTLAQRRGLVPSPAPQATLGHTHWRRIVDTSRLRGDFKQPCSICLEPFGLRDALITSCGHVFHANCLNSFERFAAASADGGGSGLTARRCPMCRAGDYQKHPYVLGAAWHREGCIVRLQAAVRGWLARRAFGVSRAAWYAGGGGDAHLRRRYFAERLSQAGGRLQSAVQARGDAVDALLASVDANILAARAQVEEGVAALAERAFRRRAGAGAPAGDVLGRALAAARPEPAAPSRATPAHPGSNGASPSAAALSCRSHFGAAFSAACSRAGPGPPWCSDCPICMLPAEWGVDSDLPRPATLLRCGHTFHAACMAAWEAFQRDQPTCPVCRAQYTRITLDADHTQALALP